LAILNKAKVNFCELKQNYRHLAEKAKNKRNETKQNVLWAKKTKISKRKIAKQGEKLWSQKIVKTKHN